MKHKINYQPNPTVLIQNTAFKLFQLTQQVFVVKIDKYSLQILKTPMYSMIVTLGLKIIDTTAVIGL